MCTISCNNLKYTIPGNCSYESKTILKDLSTIFKPGKLNIIMGSTGAGKTTLLNVIAKRVASRYVQGQVCIDKRQYTLNQFSRNGSYVMQQEYLAQSLTVYQTIQFAARLSLAGSNQEIKFAIDDIIHQLNLEKCQNTLVGGDNLKGISGGQKKRTSIAFELISGGDIIILDEPTSGMDSFTAHIIIKYLKKLATRNHKNVIMTIHQPNTEISCMFDNLTFLTNGKIVYDGRYNDFLSESGVIKGGLLKYLKHIDEPCQQNISLVDHLTEMCSFLNDKSQKNVVKLQEEYNKRQKPGVLQQIQNIEERNLDQQMQNVCFLNKFYYLLKREFQRMIAKPSQIFSKLFVMLIVSALIGLIYLNIGKKQLNKENFYYDLNSRILKSSLSIILIWLGIGYMFFKLFIFPNQKNYILKQYQAGYYSYTLYFFVKIIADIPVSLLIMALEQIILYFMLGFAIEFERMLFFSVTLVLFSLIYQTVGNFFGFLINDRKSIAITTITFKSLQMIFSGFNKNRQDYYPWIGWAQYLTVDKYAFISLMKNELEDKSPLMLQSNNFEEWLTKQNCLYALLIQLVVWMLAAGICGAIKFKTHSY